MTENESVEARIINAAIECLERYGIQAITIRKIAEMAGVNSAAINYYFRSKEALIDKVMEVTLNNAFDWKDVEQLPGGSAQERCAAVFEHIIEGGCRYPGVSRAHFYGMLMEGKTDTPAVIRLNAFLNRLTDDLKAKGAKMERAELRMAVAQVAFACLMGAIAPHALNQGFKLDFCDAKTRGKFVRRLVEKVIL